MMANHQWRERRCTWCNLARTGNGYQRIQNGFVVVSRNAGACPRSDPNVIEVGAA